LIVGKSLPSKLFWCFDVLAYFEEELALLATHSSSCEDCFLVD